MKLHSSKKSAFTLIEVLIVVVIMAILAATIIPQFASSTNDAKKSALQFNLNTIRAQIELYKINHNGSYPTSAATLENLLTSKTDIDGNVGTTSTYKYGPYIQGGKLPENPFNNLRTVTTLSAGTIPTTGDNASGWLFDPTTGNFYPNCPEAYEN